MYSCSNDDSSLNTSLELNEEIDPDLLREIKSRYGADITFEDNSFKITYDDGSDLVLTEETNGNYIIKGSKINYNVIQVNYLPSSYETDNIEVNNFTFKVLNENENYNRTTSAAPCGQHPGNEGFNECFAREWSDFCDGVIGCVTQFTSPHIVAAIIAAHCATC